MKIANSNASMKRVWRRRRLSRLALLASAMFLVLGAACTAVDEDTDASSVITSNNGSGEAVVVAPQPVDLAYLPNPTVPPPINRTTSEVVKITLEIQEIDGRLDDGSGFNYWTFGGTVPGDFLRIREGDTVEMTLINAASNRSTHNIDLHVVNGPGGGAAITNVDPGQSKTFRFKATTPGLFIYHCAVPSSRSTSCRECTA